ncbi:amine sulfotransferase-like [Ambystoma mexicanum]|uniref:amine sulfotransferase-like n=1 Tax=Ambystoma mexicanum TaxID=8296 RepID=UPI0037E722B7
MDKANRNVSMSKLFLHKGIYFLEGFVTPEYIDSLKDFPVRDSDVFLITYPKSGTVWAQQILSLIYHEGHLRRTEHIKTMFRVPWLEYNVNNMDYDARPSPRLLTTHLPHYLVPKGLKNKKAKIIYVTRNPKDNMVSYFHFMIMQNKHDGTEIKPLHMGQFMEQYLTGTEVFPCSWIDHVSGWYAHKDEFNILFLSYEEMIKDLRGVIQKICSFLGKQLDDQTVDTIVEQATFRNMKKDPLANYALNFATNKETKEFLRKGTIGDWKNIMTVAQNERFDSVLQERLKDLPIKFIWDITEII